MKYISVLNGQGQNSKFYPETVKDMSKPDFKKKFGKHIAFPDKVYEQGQAFLKAEKAAAAKIKADAEAAEKKAEQDAEAYKAAKAKRDK